jgi:hypothetical protein
MTIMIPSSSCEFRSRTISSTSARLRAELGLVLGDARDHLVVELLHDPEQADPWALAGRHRCLPVSGAVPDSSSEALRALRQCRVGRRRTAGAARALTHATPMGVAFDALRSWR